MDITQGECHSRGHFEPQATLSTAMVHGRRSTTVVCSPHVLVLVAKQAPLPFVMLCAMCLTAIRLVSTQGIEYGEGRSKTGGCEQQDAGVVM